MKATSTEHIDYAIIAQAHTPMYLIHKYWARKPHNVVSEYIRHYSKEGEIVLDPFGGSGVTAIEAIKAGRKAISIDLNPMSAFIIENTLSQVNPREIEEQFRKIETKLKDKINRLYETKCPKCGKKVIAICLHWDKSKPIKVMFECDPCNLREGRNAAKFDLKKIKESDKLKLKWHPPNKLAYDGNLFKEGTHLPEHDSLDKLFTKRNLYALSLIFHEVERIERKKLQNAFKFAFTSMVHLASIMTPVRPTRLFSSFWPVHRYWVPPVYMESNIWMLFESAVHGKQGLLKGKADAAEQIKLYKRARSLREMNDGANILFETANALELTKIIPPDSVDYIFTDPPYGGAIQYFELSTLWTAWLKMEMDFADGLRDPPGAANASLAG